MLLLLFQQHIAVLERGLGIVDRAGADDDEKSLLRIGAIDNRNNLLAAVENCTLGLGGLRDLVLKQIGGRQRVVATNYMSLSKLLDKGSHVIKLTPPVFAVGLVADILVLNVE